MSKLLTKLKKRYPKYLHKLFEYGEAGLLGDDGIVAYETIGIAKKDSDMLIKMAMDEDFNQLIYDEDDDESEESLAVFASCHALIALAEFEAHQFSKQLMSYFDSIDEDDDYYLDALAYFFAANWVHNIERFRATLDPNSNNQRKKVFIFHIFGKIFKYFKEDSDISQIETMIVDFLKHDKNNHVELNELALSCLVDDIDGLKHIELIRWCFEHKDMGMADLEEIEYELGLREAPSFKTPHVQKDQSQSFLGRFFSFWKR